MSFRARELLAVSSVLASLLGTASSGFAVCGTDPADALSVTAALAAADSECDGCVTQTHAQYLRCVARVARAAVDAGAIRRACKRTVVRRAAALPCPLGATPGPSPVTRICNGDTDCLANEFCECLPGSCSKSGGTCVPRPAACFDLVAPVCGCDGKTYLNDCRRRVAGVCKQANGPCQGGQCFDTIQRQCTGQTCSAGQHCPLPNELCVTVCPPPPPTGTCFDALGKQCTGQSCSPGTPCPPNAFCLAQCPPPTGMCFDTLARRCTAEACSPAQPCPLPNEFCTPRCPPPPSTTTSTTLPGPMCQKDTDCDDGNPCTFDRCVDGTCQHECVCVGPGGALQCCPGPAAQCPPPPTSTTTTLPSAPTWFYTCGDPVCGGHRSHPGVPPCSAGEVAGAPCAPEGATCDPGDACNRLLLCTTSDPTHGGLCPISRRASKENIQYLGAVDVQRLRDELMRFRLATYEYKGAGSERHLGFIIDDIEPSAAVDPGRDMVDLYGYTSMAVAALQSQAREIAALKKEVARLRRASHARDEAGNVCGVGPAR